MKTINTTFRTTALALITAVTVLLSSCSDDESAVKAKVTTSEATDVTFNSATVPVTIAAKGTGAIQAKGICYSTAPAPTISGDTTQVQGTETNFEAVLDELTPNTTYYARAYVINKAGISYSNEISFSTGDGLPTVTIEIPKVFFERAEATLNITNTGASGITNSGFVYSSEHTVPTIIDYMWPSSSSDLEVDYTISDLAEGQTYYVRAFAQNAQGIAYSAVAQFTTKTVPAEITDVDGNTYDVVKIGDYAWLAENLRVTKYNNGDPIATTTADVSGESTPKYQWVYNNDEANASTYGRYYTYYAMMDDRKVCPDGTHLSTMDEWMNMNDVVLNGQGSKLKTTGTSVWNSPNTGASNVTGFNAPGAGYRSQFSLFFNLKEYGFYLTSDAHSDDANLVYGLYLSYNDSYLWLPSLAKKSGYSVRCVVD
jgi:uncharacterized protein (TIGR02145 family)